MDPFRIVEGLAVDNRHAMTFDHGRALMEGLSSLLHMDPQSVAEAVCAWANLAVTPV
jgi:hypothetical protein